MSFEEVSGVATIQFGGLGGPGIGERPPSSSEFSASVNKSGGLFSRSALKILVLVIQGLSSETFLMAY